MIRRPRNALALVCGVSLAWAQAAPEQYSPAFLSSPAFQTSDLPDGPAGSLVVFSHGAEAVPIRLPFPARHVVYSPDGKSLYAQPMPLGACLYKIEFNPTRSKPVACPPGLQFQGVAVSRSEDRLLFSGRYGSDGNLFCGVFEILLPGGTIRPVLKASCPGEPWDSLSYSPDGKRAVGVVAKAIGLFAKSREAASPFPPSSVVVIELDSGAARSIGSGFLPASWSPDGRWIAAVQNGGGSKTVLFDATSFAKVKTLPGSEAEWSPDSRYLLRVDPCANETGTVEAVSVDSGEGKPILSSRCKVYNVSTGWVSDSILPQNSGGQGAAPK